MTKGIIHDLDGRVLDEQAVNIYREGVRACAAVSEWYRIHYDYLVNECGRDEASVSNECFNEFNETAVRYEDLLRELGYSKYVAW